MKLTKYMKVRNGHEDHYFFFVPEGETRTLAEIGDQDPVAKASKYGDAIHDFAKWYQSR